MTKSIGGNLTAAAFALAAGALWQSPALAQAQGAADYPNRTITLVVPYAAGGPVDTVARIIGQRMGEILGQQIIVENVAGAGGMVGSLRVAQAAPDGYTVLYGGSAVLAQNQATYKKPLVDGNKDFTFVSMFADQARVLVVRKDFPAQDMKSFFDFVKANEAKITYGSAGSGSGSHICPLILDKINGTKVTHVPYRGSSQALQDLIAGRLDFMAEQVSTVAAQVEAGNIKAIAVLGNDRVTSMPNLPTALEQGVQNLDCGSWQALLLPKGAPDAVVRKLAAAVDQTVETPSVVERFTAIGVSVPAKERRTPEYLAKFTPTEIVRWGAIIKGAGISAD
ncbi:MAG: tripartite tricarboxylate transporter substrate binding protein [Beijerinckiaceae bacterium]|nr:tripartite tricarboxylate transporter substrate binding protein [Beijerinckiaceae bacterium]